MFKTPLFQLSLCTVGCLCATSKISLAQVTTDNTVNTQVEQNGNVAEITGGETRGGNLFHSFQDFSIPTGNEAFFNNANDISNILSRVTGRNVSNIDGLIRANGSASLFLINPAGIIFGENASLNIGGSFYGSSASSILFEDGEFSAVDLENPPLLTVNAPIGLGFRDNPGDIVNRASTGDGLEVLEGQNISLIGGNINLDGGEVFAIGGRVELGGLTTSGVVNINENGSLSFPDNVARGNVSLDNSSITVLGQGGGSIGINAKNLTLISGSNLGIAITDFSEAQGGDIIINATEDVVLDTSGNENTITTIFNNNFGNGDAGDIEINSRNISLINGAAIINFGNREGSIGNINITATEDIVFDGIFQNSFVGGIQNSINSLEDTNTSSNVESLANIGAINITAQNLNLTNGAGIQSLVAEVGNSGDINVNISDTISINGEGEGTFLEEISAPGLISSGITSQIAFEGLGNSGDINIFTNNLLINNGGVIDTSNAGQGNAGDINIQAETINLDGQGAARTINNNGQNLTISATSRISSRTVSGGVFDERTIQGNGGNININTGSLFAVGGASVDAFSSGIGNGGNIAIEAREQIFLSGTTREGIVSSNISSNLVGDGFGNGGSIDIDTPKLFVTNSAQIAAFTRTEGNAGFIKITSSDSIEISNDAIVAATVEFGGIGNGGNLTLETKKLSIRDGGQILGDTSGEGDAGSVFIRTTDSIELVGFASFISAGVESGATGNGGNLEIETGQLTVLDSGEISVESLGVGEAGELTIQANSIQLEDGRIDAATPLGEGGSITLSVADDITLRDNSFISAKALNNANGGNLSIDSRFITAFPSNGNGNDIIANAEQGQGGNITINAESLFGISEGVAVEGNGTNDIDASSEFSLDGNVTINTPDINPIQRVTELTSNIVVPEQTTAQACRANRESVAKNGLTIKGKGGIPQAPELPLISQNIVINGESTNNISATPQPLETSQGKIQPARGIKVSEGGKITLTAYRTNNSGERLPEIKSNCGV